MKKQTFPCDYCNFKSEKMENVVNHFKTHHDGCYKLKCWFCGKEVKTMDEFRMHIGTYHYTAKYEEKEN